MDRLNFYFQQLLGSGDLDDAFDKTERAIRSTSADAGVVGVVSGLVPAAQVSPNLTVSLSAGVAYDKTGKRLAVAGGQTVDLSVDETGANTAVTTPTWKRYVSVFLRFVRDSTDARVDGNNVSIFYQNSESYKIRVVMGAESFAPTYPAADATDIRLFDVLRSNGDATVSPGDIQLGNREDAIAAVGSPFTLRAGTAKTAIEAFVERYNAHVSFGGDSHSASQVSYSGGGTWADATTNPSRSLEAQIDDMITALGGTAGSAKIGHVGGVGSTVKSNLDDLAGQITTLQGATGGITTSRVISATNGEADGAAQWEPRLGHVASLTSGITHWYVEVTDLLPHGAIVTEASVRVCAENTGVMPASKPRVVLVARARATLGVAIGVIDVGGTLLGTEGTDPNVNLAGYAVVHDIAAATVSATPIDRVSNRYFLRVRNESGANAAARLRIFEGRVSFTTTAIDKASA